MTNTFGDVLDKWNTYKINLVDKDFVEYSYFYMMGYEIKDIIDDEKSFKEQFSSLSKENAEYFNRYNINRQLFFSI